MIWEPNLNVETKAQGAAATVYTPNGTLVNDTYYRSEELSASQKRAMTNIVQQPIHKQL